MTPRRSNPTLLAASAQRKAKSAAKKVDSPAGWLFAPAEEPEINAEEKDAPISRRIYTVQSLVSEVRHLTERSYADVWVQGEISNLRPATSGHLYFTLKDDDAQLSVVLFRRQGGLLRFKPQDGMAVLARGKISIYENRGQLQLVADTLEPMGAGALQIAFEQLKTRLAAEGLFAAERKRPLPPYPATIGIITSPSGAVIQDMLNILERRHARLNVLLYPAVVQGENTAMEFIDAIEYFNQQDSPVDVILLARGGGSIEDLAGFNDEALARAIAASRIPVVSAIGHETDFTIADFAADLRAPTPSAAAELVTAAQHRIEEQVAELTHRVLRATRYQMMRARENYTRLSADAVLNRLEDALARRMQRLDDQQYRMHSAIERTMRGCFRAATLLRDRILQQDVSQQLAKLQTRLAQGEARLRQVPQMQMEKRRARLATASARLQSLSPLAVLGRGYALVYDASGKLISRAEDAAAGTAITARLAHGSLSATVTRVNDDNKK